MILSQKKINNIKFFIFFAFTISLIANNFQCRIDTIKYLKSGKFQSIPKGDREKVTLAIKKNTVILTTEKKGTFKLFYRGTKKLMNIIDTDIYSNNSVQLEIIDISESWSVGARFFIGDRMLVMGTCKH